MNIHVSTRRLFLGLTLLGINASAFPVLGFDFIDINYSGSVSSNTQDAMNAAKNFWQTQLTGYVDPTTTHRLQITVSPIVIRGMGAETADGGVTNYVQSGNYSYATQGVIHVNSAASTWLSNDTNAKDGVAIHEMAHVLGFGTLWTQNNVYNNGTGQYTGKYAIAAYRAEFNQPNANYVPVQLGATGPDSHWAEKNGGLSFTGVKSILNGKDMRDELMTPWESPAQWFVSNTTIQSFRDLGYTVNPSTDPANFAPVVAAPMPAPTPAPTPAPAPPVVVSPKRLVLANSALGGMGVATGKSSSATMDSVTARLDKAAHGERFQNDLGGSYMANSYSSEPSNDMNVSRATCLQELKMDEDSFVKDPANGLFAIGTYSDISQNSSGASSATTGSSFDALIGYDRKLSAQWIVGCAFTYNTSTYQTADSLNHTKSNAYGAIAYARFSSEKNWFINTAAGYRHLTLDLTTTVPVVGDATGNTSGDQLLGSLRGGYNITLARNVTLIPFTEFSYTTTQVAGYTEKGSAAAFSFANSSSNQGRASAGFDFAQDFTSKDKVIFGYHAGLAAHYLVTDQSAAILASVIGSSQQYDATLLPLSKFSGSAMVGVNADVGSVSLFVNGHYTLASDQHEIGVSLGARFNF